MPGADFGMGCKASFEANSSRYWQKINAADRPEAVIWGREGLFRGSLVLGLHPGESLCLLNVGAEHLRFLEHHLGEIFPSTNGS